MNKRKFNPFKRSTWRPDYRTPTPPEEQRIWHWALLVGPIVWQLLQ